MHPIYRTCCPKQAEAKNSQTKGLQNAFLLPELHFQSGAVVFSLLNLSLQPWNKHATFCSKILKFFWRQIFHHEKRFNLSLCRLFPRVAGDSWLCPAKTGQGRQAVFSWDSQDTLLQLWEELCRTVREGNQIPADASLPSGQWDTGRGWKLLLNHMELSHADTVLHSLQTAMQDVLSSLCGGYFFWQQKKITPVFFSLTRDSNRVRHGIIMATYANSSASYTRDQQKPLMKPLVSVFFPCLSYHVLIGYFLKKVRVVFQKAWHQRSHKEKFDKLFIRVNQSNNKSAGY